MMLTQASKPSDFRVVSSDLASFRGVPRYVVVKGTTLVRLKQRGRSSVVRYWFDLSDWERLRRNASEDLKGSESSLFKGSDFQAPTTRGDLIGVYLRLCFREDLAVRKDWTENFDSVVKLRLPKSSSLIALVETVASQPVYSEGHENHESSKGIVLPGGLRQFFIDFDCKANQEFAHLIGMPEAL